MDVGCCAWPASLAALAAECGVSAHVRFVNKYVTTQDLVEYLAATDVYVTPYLNERQITSGTLSYAVALGKPVVSTPYWHAEELLAGSGWMPEPLRTAGQTIGATSSVSEPGPILGVASVGEESALTGYETAMVDPDWPPEDARELSRNSSRSRLNSKGADFTFEGPPPAGLPLMRD